MKVDAGKIAALSMIRLTEQESTRLDADVSVILALREALPGCSETAEAFDNACTADQLRADCAEQTVPPERMRALSENEKDGFLHIVRTVG